MALRQISGFSDGWNVEYEGGMTASIPTQVSG